MERNIEPTTLVLIMKKLLGSLALAAMIVAIAPRAALAEEGGPSRELSQQRPR
jgi:hypothetical protein